MFQELLDKASLVGHKMAVYRILTKDAQTLTAEDLEELSAMVSEAAALEFVDSRFLLEETALSLSLIHIYLRTGAVRRLSGRRGRLRKRGAILPGMVQEGGARSGSAVGG